MAITPFWIFLKIQMIAISFFFSFLHHLYFFQTQIFCLLCFVSLFVWLSWNASWLSACKSHLWEKQYVWVCCVYGESVHSQVERWHSQLLESKHFFLWCFNSLRKKKLIFYSWGIDAWLPNVAPSSPTSVFCLSPRERSEVLLLGCYTSK